LKILHTVEFYAPSTGGSQEVVKQISERMAAIGHDVTIATTKDKNRKFKSLNGVKIEEFDIYGNQVIGMHGDIEKYKQFLTKNNFDVIMNYAAQQWATDVMFEVIDNVKAKKVVVPCGYSALHNPDFENYFKTLPSILKKYDKSIYLTKHYQDYIFAKKNHVKNLTVIPNGADENEFDNIHTKNDFKKKNGINNFFILSIGNHTGSKGHSELLKVFSEFPHPSDLVIIGAKSDDGCYEDCLKYCKQFNKTYTDKKIHILTVPRADTIDALKSADIFMFLSNVEASPIVLFESAAAGLPFIATNAGNSKEIAKLTKGGVIVKTLNYKGRKGDVIADLPSSLRYLNKLYSNEKLRQRMAKTARSNWLKEYTWDKITRRYLSIYEEILNK